MLPQDAVIKYWLRVRELLQKSASLTDQQADQGIREYVALAEARGFRIGEIEVNHRPRRFGYSKYGIRRFVKGFLDLLTVKFLTGFGHRPQHMLGGIGIFCFFLGLAGMGYLSHS